MQVTVLMNQTLADIAVQQYGTVEAMPLIASANSISLSADLYKGQVLECPEKEFDAYLENYVKSNNIKPATK